MNKIRMGYVFLAGFVASLTFIFTEMVLEGSVQFIFRFSEAKLFLQAFDRLPSGTLYHILNLLYLYLVCTLIMWIYAAIRPRFKKRLHAALGTSLVFWLFVFLFFGNYSNMGLYPYRLTLLAIGFNLVEIPAAVIGGSLVYRE